MNTPMLIGDGTSVLMYVFLVCCVRLASPPSAALHWPISATRPLSSSPHINTSPCTTAKAGNGAEPKRKRERESEKAGKREREKERVASSQPTNQPTHANTLRSLAEYCPIAKEVPRKCPLDGRLYSSRLNWVRTGNLRHAQRQPEASWSRKGGWAVGGGVCVCCSGGDGN